MTDAQWKVQLEYLEKLRSQTRLYRGCVVPAVIPRDWPDDAYSGVAALESSQADRPAQPED